MVKKGGVFLGVSGGSRARTPKIGGRGFLGVQKKGVGGLLINDFVGVLLTPKPQKSPSLAPRAASSRPEVLVGGATPVFFILLTAVPGSAFYSFVGPPAGRRNPFASKIAWTVAKKRLPRILCSPPPSCFRLGSGWEAPPWVAVASPLQLGVAVGGRPALAAELFFASVSHVGAGAVLAGHSPCWGLGLASAAAAGWCSRLLLGPGLGQGWRRPAVCVGSAVAAAPLLGIWCGLRWGPCGRLCCPRLLLLCGWLLHGCRVVGGCRIWVAAGFCGTAPPRSIVACIGWSSGAPLPLPFLLSLLACCRYPSVVRPCRPQPVETTCHCRCSGLLVCWRLPK